MLEETLIMIKPEGIEYIDNIIEIIVGLGYEVSKEYPIICSENFLKRLYCEQSGAFWEVNKEYLLDKRCVVFIISGEQAKKQIFSIVGTNCNPEECEKNSLRYIFGKREPYIGKNGRKLFLNAIHRSNPENAEYEVDLLKNILM